MQKILIIILIVLMAAMAFAGCGQKLTPIEPPDEPEHAKTDPAPEVDLDAIISDMTTEEKVAQLLMPAFRSYSPDGYTYKYVTELPEDLAGLLSRHGFGGVILFAENSESTEQMTRLIHQMQTANSQGPNPGQLLMGVDQEGGMICRLATGTKFSGNMGLGATADPASARVAGEIIGKEIKACGFNFDLAPVVDVNNNPSNPVINLRSFSDDPNTAANFGKAFVEGLHQAGVASSLKHFPGHGNTSTDSHTGFPRIDGTYEELAASELISFKACMDQGADAVMTAHIQYPGIETETYTSRSTGQQVYLPATLSRTIITDILRGKLGFSGVVITDAMNMDAIAVNFSSLDAARLALNAGVDLILMPVNVTDKSGIEKLEQYIRDVAAMVDAGTIDPSMVDAAVKRVLNMKLGLDILNKYDGTDIEARVKAATDLVGCASHHEKEWEIAKDTLTVIKNDGAMLPLNREGEKTVIFIPKYNMMDSADYALKRLEEDGKLTSGFIQTVCYEEYGVTAMAHAAEGADNVVIVTRTWSVKDAAGILNNVDGLIQTVHQKGGRAAVLSCYMPYDVARFTSADAIGLCYGYGTAAEDPRVTDHRVEFTPNLPAALYMYFDGTASFTGKLPLDIPALNADNSFSDTVLFPRGTGLS